MRQRRGGRVLRRHHSGSTRVALSALGSCMSPIDIMESTLSRWLWPGVRNHLSPPPPSSTLDKSTRALLAITPLSSFRLHEGSTISLGLLHVPDWHHGEHPQPLAMTRSQKSSLIAIITVTLSKSTRHEHCYFQRQNSLWRSRFR